MPEPPPACARFLVLNAFFQLFDLSNRYITVASKGIVMRQELRPVSSMTTQQLIAEASRGVQIAKSTAARLVAIAVELRMRARADDTLNPQESGTSVATFYVH